MSFITRHIGPSLNHQRLMLEVLGYQDLDTFIKDVVPNNLLTVTNTTNKPELSEYEALQNISKIASQNKIFKSLAGMGYYDTITPTVIKRNVLENPGWYTAYTPYQAEISQGRLEALLNYQQMVMDLTGFDLANASLLDEATACAEGMLMASRINTSSNKFFVESNVFPQSLSVVKTRAKYAGIEVIVGNIEDFNPNDYFGLLIQNPRLNGEICDYTDIVKNYKAKIKDLESKNKMLMYILGTVLILNILIQLFF